MGYAGYFSTTARIKDRKTPLEASLATIDSLATLELLEKATYNVVVQPAEDKFRRLKLSNAKIRASVVEVEGGLAAMRELGWQQGQEGGEAVLTLPRGVASMAQVRAIQEAQQELKKRSAKDLVQRTKSAASLPGSAEQEALRQQLEADRAERAAREPVTQGSVAQPLPGSGPRVAGARDAGFNDGGCAC